jgi:putative acetyltransferase
VDFIIRTQRPTDLEAVRHVVTWAFDNSVVGELAVELWHAPACAAGLSCVAEFGGRVVGHVILTRAWVDAPERLVEVLVLGPLGVVPEQQRQGIGGALVAHALREAEKVGAPLVFLEGHPDYYPRFGFEPAGPLGFVKPSVRIPDAAFQVVTLPAYQPWMTGALVYAEQFWAYDCVGLR